MNGVVRAVLLFSLLLLPLEIDSGEPPQKRPHVDKSSDGGLALSIPAASGRRYQVYSSPDLRTWEFFGNVVKADGDTFVIPLPQIADSNRFFRIEERPQLGGVVSRMERAGTASVQLRFPTKASTRYQAYGSLDLKTWEPVGPLLEGDDNQVGLEFSATDPAMAFFRVEQVDPNPLPQTVWIPAGTFTMGSPRSEKDRDLDEDPLTLVTITRGFWMGKYEVTQADFQAVMGVNPSYFKGNLNLPVDSVSWTQAMEFCRRITESESKAGRLPEGFTYRLPTEAEFEFASRAGTTNRYSFGDDFDYVLINDHAWYDKNSGGAPHPVGQKKPNPLGLHDIHGNVWEWCLDWYGDRYPGGAVSDPRGPATGIHRVFRGGGWDYLASYCRSAFRNRVGPARGKEYLGFRVVLSSMKP
jgi:formylglycine-generating enzyme required for sulfatase activity